MLKTFKIEIKPTAEQIGKIHQTIGNCRFVYNFYLKHNQELFEAWKAAGSPEGERHFLTGYDFSKWINNVWLPEHPECSWLKLAASKAIKKSIMNAETAFKRFFKGLSSFPRFKKKSSLVKMYLPRNNKTDWAVERHRIKIPTLGFVRLKEFGYCPKNADVKSGTVSYEAGKYYVAVLCEVPDWVVPTLTYIEGIGVDLGIKNFAVVSNGIVFSNINRSRKIKGLNKRLRRAQRAFSRKLHSKKGEANKGKSRLRVQKLYQKLRNKRTEYVKYCVNSLVRLSPQFIAIEDLNIRGMVKNRHLSKAIQNQQFYYFRQYLLQKAAKYGIEIRVIDWFFPSSKLCMKCGTVKTDLKLSDRVFKCDCEHTEDRDLNASINIRNWCTVG